MLRKLFTGVTTLILMAFVVLTRPMVFAVMANQSMPPEDRIIFSGIILLTCFLIIGFAVLLSYAERDRSKASGG